MIDAWGDLTGDRNTELGPIPFVSIDRWASRFGIDDPDHFAFLVRAIRSADSAFLSWAAEEMKRDSSPQGRKHG